jgi:hypothetical protein
MTTDGSQRKPVVVRLTIDPYPIDIRRGYEVKAATSDPAYQVEPSPTVIGQRLTEGGVALSIVLHIVPSRRASRAGK